MKKNNNNYCAITYSWENNVYNLIKRLSIIYKNIWLDIVCINQFDEITKNKQLLELQYAYQCCDCYYVDGLTTLKRYWCCFEIATVFKFNENVNSNFNVGDDYFKESEKINISYLPKNVYEHLKKTYNSKYFKLNESKITYEKDKIFINNNILKWYNNFDNYENTVNEILENLFKIYFP